MNIRRAAQLAPAFANAKANLADVAATLGRLDEAVAIDRQALKLDPLRPDFYLDLGLDLMALGRFDEAEKAIRSAIALQPDGSNLYGSLSKIDVLRGNAAAALANAKKEPAGVYRDIAVARALQIGSDRAAADAALKTLITRYSDDAPVQIAETYGQRKEADKVFEWLEHARAVKDPGLVSLLIDPFLQPYRHDPRFAKLCEELKLPATKDL